MVESSKIHRIQGCEATFTSPTAGSPQIDGRNPALPRARTINVRGPDQDQRDTVLATVKAWPGDDGVRGTCTATAILDGVCARRHWTDVGRDEETALRSNKETDQDRKKAKSRNTTSKSA